ncbi:MAG: hypothetical protein LBP53_00240 [Candidatus Peribacteria bacterium]|jgi:hypothetical protein|nr:hypothetical protein [Candidatus Peribacteria bacterium]
MNYEPTYKALHLLTPNDESNLQRIITTPQLSFAQKKDILKEKVTTLVSTIQNTMRETEETKKNIAKFGFLPEEIRTILAEENAISSIQRSLSSLEIIKFSTALNIFSYLDSVVGLIADALKMDKEKVANILDDLAARGERDVSAYVYMCYLNPFELNQDCASIGDFDLYYQDIMKDKDFDRGLFKNLMKYIDTLLENSDIPSFSILFH